MAERLAHDVYFTLKDPSDDAVAKLVAACHEYLKDHDGVEFFAAGRLADEFQRDVNDRGFHVALHVVFRDKAAHDVYQDAPAHLRFIEENKATWAGVRVCDAYVTS